MTTTSPSNALPATGKVYVMIATLNRSKARFGAYFLSALGWLMTFSDKLVAALNQYMPNIWHGWAQHGPGITSTLSLMGVVTGFGGLSWLAAQRKKELSREVVAPVDQAQPAVDALHEKSAALEQQLADVQAKLDAVSSLLPKGEN